MRREQTDLAAVGTEGTSPNEATEVEAFAAEIREGLGAATPTDRRRLYELFRLRGTVHADADGVRLGTRNRFRVGWTAAIPLPHSLNRNL